MCKGETELEIPAELQYAFRRADELDEMIQHNALVPAILSGVEAMTERDVSALRALWAGRSKADKEKPQQVN